MVWVCLIILYVILFFASYILMSLRRKTLKLTYGRYECDPTMLVSLAAPPIGIIFATADLIAFHLGLREPGYYFNGERCSTPR